MATTATVGSHAFGLGQPGQPTVPAAVEAAYHLAYLEQEALRLGIPPETVKAIVDLAIRGITEMVRDAGR